MFAAWLPKNQTAAQITKELKARAKLTSLTTRGEVEVLFAKIRADGVAPVTQHYVFDGVNAVAAPVFNFKNQITMSIAVVGVDGISGDLGPGSTIIAELKKAAQALSWGLGATHDQEPETAPNLPACAMNAR